MVNVYVLCLMVDDEIVKPIRVFPDMDQVSVYVKKHAIHSKTRAFRVPYGLYEFIDTDGPEETEY
jgi:hypothetical protein